MKLYYYILPMGKEPQSIIRTKECEVEKCGSGYRPVQGSFPIGYNMTPGAMGTLKVSTIGYEKNIRGNTGTGFRLSQTPIYSEYQ